MYEGGPMQEDKIRTILFPYLNKTIEVEAENTIADACEQAGVPLELVCGGKGVCGKCKVWIEKDNKKQEVLGCQEKVTEGLKIFIKKQKQNTLNILTHNKFHQITMLPEFKKVYIDTAHIIMKDGYGDWESIKDYLEFSMQTPSISLFQKISDTLHKNTKGITLVVYKDRLMNIEEGDTTKDLYGIAVDLGTTSIAAYFYNLVTGEKMGVYSALNKQTSEGADVLSRIMAAAHQDGLKRLQALVVETINELVFEATEELNIKCDHIYFVTICGNSVMQHLLLAMNPKHLGRAPFTSVTLSDIEVKAKTLTLCINPAGIIYALPLIGGFVGSDTVAAALASEVGKSKRIKLLIDLGTNGEIVVGNHEKMLVASAAAGPAMEGAGIKFGMRGMQGAIDRVSLSRGSVEIEVIGRGRPSGICGSGLIDLAAEMLKMRLIDHQGRLSTREDYIQIRGNNALADRLQNINGERVFIIAYENESDNSQKIYITQKDIRALQLAKGAIAAAYNILLKKYGIMGEELDEIILAGAFGNYIDIKQAQYIGLLPKFKDVPVHSVGNAAGAGAQLVLLSKDKKAEMFSMVEKIQHVELASDINFQDVFSKALDFSIEPTY